MDVTPACHAQSQIRCRLRRFRHQPIVIQGYAAMNKSTRSSTSVLLPRILQKRAADPADRWSYAFLDSQGGEQCRWTADDLAARTRAIAAHIGRVTSPGEPVLLVLQAGPEFLAAFMACLWSGRLATPINPPRRNRLIDRLVAVAGDSMARVALTSQDMMGATQEWRESSAELGELEWIPTDQIGRAHV